MENADSAEGGGDPEGSRDMDKEGIQKDPGK